MKYIVTATVLSLEDQYMWDVEPSIYNNKENACNYATHGENIVNEIHTPQFDKYYALRNTHKVVYTIYSLNC